METTQGMLGAPWRRVDLRTTSERSRRDLRWPRGLTDPVMEERARGVGSGEWGVESGEWGPRLSVRLTYRAGGQRRAAAGSGGQRRAAAGMLAMQAGQGRAGQGSPGQH